MTDTLLPLDKVNFLIDQHLSISSSCWQDALSSRLWLRSCSSHLAATLKKKPHRLSQCSCPLPPPNSLRSKPCNSLREIDGHLRCVQNANWKISVPMWAAGRSGSKPWKLMGFLRPHSKASVTELQLQQSPNLCYNTLHRISPYFTIGSVWNSPQTCLESLKLKGNYVL